MNQSLKISLCLFSICLSLLQTNAQTQGILWVGSRSSVSIIVPAELAGIESPATLVKSSDLQVDGLKGTITLKSNPDGKIVSLTAETNRPDRINVHCLESAYANRLNLQTAPSSDGRYWFPLEIIKPDDGRYWIPLEIIPGIVLPRTGSNE